jgi:hypothetical protein
VKYVNSPNIFVVAIPPSHISAMIHSDVWGPLQVKNITGTTLFVSFVDDHTRLTWLFLMKDKFEVGQIFQNFNSMIQTQFHTKIQILKTDDAKEYFNSDLNTYYLSQGIIHISSCVDTAQQNGVAEIKNRHLLEIARSLMFQNNYGEKLYSQLLIS